MTSPDELRRKALPITHAIDALYGIVILTFTRQPTFWEWTQALRRMLDDPDYRAGMGVVSDRRGLEDTVEASTVRQMADWMVAHRGAFPGCRWAVLVSAGATADYGMARMKAILFERAGIEAEAFTNFDEALGFATRSRESAGK